MININIVCVGKIKESFYRDAVAEYLKRLGRFAAVKIIETDDCPDGDTERIRSTEAKSVMPKLKGYIVALDIGGKNMDSPAFADFIDKSASSGSSTITFVIGGSHGLDKCILERADMKLSFGKFTYPHQLMRVILIEQIYRAFMINANSAYHK